jgi:arylsulfatase A-like enzyme/Tfp pilus assembly protein PilF
MQPRGREDTSRGGSRTAPTSWFPVFVFIATAAGCSHAGSQADLRPIPHQNVLLITIDTLRADALGCYGGQAATPALDRLAADGVRFDFAHAHAVLTLPSHASILTGQYPFQHGLRDNSGYRLPPSAHTAATMLKQAGYATAAFVAGFPLHSRFGLNQGFDVYDDRLGDTRAPTEFVMPERPASTVVPLARAWIAGRAPSTQAPSTLAPSTQHLAPSTGTPWFLWLHLFDPHAPYRPPPPFDATYAGRPYYGEVAATDAALAALLDDVRALGTPTLVIVTSDHGEALGDHGEQSHGLFAYESTLKVPLIIAELSPNGRTQRPQRSQRNQNESVFAGLARFAFQRIWAEASAEGSPSGEVSSVAARHIDILPTLLEAIGQPLPRDLPGRSLLPASERSRVEVGASMRPSYFEAMGPMLNRGWAPLAGVLLDHEKFIDVPIAERYDLSGDPAELSNLAGRSPERDRTLAASLRAYNAPAPGERVAETPDAAARLRALGYVSGHAPPKARYTDADDPKQLVALDQAIHDAVAAFGAGRAADAAGIYQRVIDRRPDMAIAYRHLAFIEAQRGNIARAIDVLQRGLGKGVTDPQLVTQLGEALVDAGRVAQGIQVLEPVAGAPNAGPEALNALGIAYARAGRAEDARRVFERVLSADPASTVPLENLGMLALERGDLATARQRFEQAIAADPRSSRAHAGAGVVALRAGNRRAAIDAWTRAVQLDPRNFDALYNLGTTLARDGQPAAARPYLEQFLRTAPRAFYAKDLEDVSRLIQKTR